MDKTGLPLLDGGEPNRLQVFLAMTLPVPPRIGVAVQSKYAGNDRVDQSPILPVFRPFMFGQPDP
eukprot:12951781-Alexandrium_andersonii.AAC.1